MMPLPNCSLLNAPSPGKNPRKNASSGLGASPVATGAAATPVAGMAGGRGEAAPGCAAGGIPITLARQSSQYNTSRTGRTQTAHSALPQLRQYPMASASGCTAHVIARSSNSLAAEPAAKRRYLHRQHFQMPRSIVGAILLPRRCGLRAIAAPTLLLRGRLRNSAFRIGAEIILFAQTRLNFVHHPQIAHELRTLPIRQMHGAVSVAINRRRP